MYISHFVHPFIYPWTLISSFVNYAAINVTVKISLWDPDFNRFSLPHWPCVSYSRNSCVKSYWTNFLAVGMATAVWLRPTVEGSQRSRWRRGSWTRPHGQCPGGHRTGCWDEENWGASDEAQELRFSPRQQRVDLLASETCSCSEPLSNALLLQLFHLLWFSDLLSPLPRDPPQPPQKQHPHGQVIFKHNTLFIIFRALS